MTVFCLLSSRRVRVYLELNPIELTLQWESNFACSVCNREKLILSFSLFLALFIPRERKGGKERSNSNRSIRVHGAVLERALERQQQYKQQPKTKTEVGWPRLIVAALAESLVGPIFFPGSFGLMSRTTPTQHKVYLSSKSSCYAKSLAILSTRRGVRSSKKK